MGPIRGIPGLHSRLGRFNSARLGDNAWLNKNDQGGAMHVKYRKGLFDDVEG